MQIVERTKYEGMDVTTAEQLVRQAVEEYLKQRAQREKGNMFCVKPGLVAKSLALKLFHISDYRDHPRRITYFIIQSLVQLGGKRIGKKPLYCFDKKQFLN